MKNFTFFFRLFYIKLVSLLILGAISGIVKAQDTITTSISSDFKDSTILAFQVKPPNKFELGIHVGMPIITGDVSPRPGYGGGISLRKAINHAFSIRADYTGANYFGLNYRLGIPNQFARNIENNPYFSNYINGNRDYVANYKTTLHQFSMQGILSLNTWSIHRGHPKRNLYVFGGYSLLLATVKADALNANGAPYNFGNGTTPVNFVTGTRSEIRSQLKNFLDFKYESMGGVLNGTRTTIGVFGNSFLRHSINGGAGYAVKINDKVNLAAEYRLTFGFTDDLDAIYKGRTHDMIHYFSARFNINIGGKTKKVEPLWWINPNVMKATETNTLIKTLVSKALDSLDTDGDGVLDIRDKEKITLQKCFPVDADGVGTCPTEPCCSDTIKIKDSTIITTKNGCDIGMTTLVFPNGSYELTEDMKATLQRLATRLKENPGCMLMLRGVMKQGMQDRVEIVRKYLTDSLNISGKRIMSYAYTREEMKTMDVHSVQVIGTFDENR